MYKNGLKNGYGEYYTKDGDVMKCVWVDNKPHGQGILILRSGEVKEAEWKNGNLLTLKKSKN